MSEETNQFNNFILEAVFPSPENLISTTGPTFDVLLTDCIFILDANTLLAPLRVGTDSLNDVSNVFRNLVGQERLFLPARAIREYARHKASHIADAYTHVSQKLSNIPPTPSALEIPMFQGVQQHTNSTEKLEQLRNAIKEYKKSLQELEAKLKNWNHDDPVSTLYSEIFTARNIVSHSKTDEEILSDLTHRFTHRIPPGYKDKSKADAGVGDLIIWHTIIATGIQFNKNVIFVTNDGKTDWMVKSGDTPLYPRYELTDEFNRACGRHFNILTFDRFLKAMGAEENTVTEFRRAHNQEVVESQTVTFQLRDATSRKQKQILAPERTEIRLILNLIKNLLEDFLDSEPYGYNGAHYITPIEPLIKLRKQFEELLNSIQINEQIDDLAHVKLSYIKYTLNQIEELNGSTEYVAYRMKVSSEPYETRLESLAREVITTIDSLELWVNFYI